MKIGKKIIILIVFAFTLFCFTSCTKHPIENQKGDNLFYRIDITTDLIQNEKVELALYEKELKIEAEGNPYDYSYMKVIAEFTTPSNKVISVPAFWYQAYSINFNEKLNVTPSSISGVASTSKDEPQGMETVTPIGDPHYRVRFTPEEVGEYSYVIKVYKNDAFVSQEHPSKFVVKEGTKASKGVIEVDPTNNRSFRYSISKETFIPMGQNTAWYTSSTRRTEDYGVWFKKMNEVGMNTARVWMATWGFCLHWKSTNDFSNSFSQAARLDKLVDFAEEYDINFMLTLINHGQFSSTVNSEWENNPYNEKKGGFLKNPAQFFTSDTAKKTYKNELLYIIARYGYSNSILAWELCNEVDWIDGYNLFSTGFKTWHNEMATFIKENDPFNHMVTTSYKGVDGNAFGLDSIDFVSPHSYAYSNKNMISGIKDTQKQMINKYDKPVFFGEIGLSGENGNQTYTQDPNGVTLHQAMWAGLMTGGAGGAMNWWWDSYVHPYNLYSKFEGATKYSKRLNLTGSDYSLLSDSSFISNSSLSVAGYKFDDRVYGYVYDSSWKYNNQNMANKTNVTLSVDFTDGKYIITFYDTVTGEPTLVKNVTCKNGKINVSLPDIKYDLAFIIK